MDYVLDNLSTILSVLSLLGVVLVFLYMLYYKDRERLRQDLEKLLGEGLRFMEKWAGDQVGEVTEEEVVKIADWFYTRYVVGSVLERFVTQAALRALFWEAFLKWRDQFITANAFRIEVDRTRHL